MFETDFLGHMKFSGCTRKIGGTASCGFRVSSEKSVGSQKEFEKVYF